MDWKSPDEVLDLIHQNPNQEWHERGEGILHAVVEEWTKAKKRKPSGKVPPSRFGKRLFFNKRIGFKDEESAISKVEGVSEPNEVSSHLQPTYESLPSQRQAQSTEPESLPLSTQSPEIPQETQKESVPERRSDPRRKPPKESRKRGVDTLELAKEGVNDIFHEMVAKMVKEGKFSTSQRAQEAQDFLRGEGRFTIGGSSVGDMLLAQAERVGLRKGDLEDILVTAATDMWKRAFNKIRENGGSWENNYPIGIGQLLQVAARSAVIDALRTTYKTRRQEKVVPFSQIGDEEAPFEESIADPGSIEALVDEPSPYVEMLNLAKEMTSQQKRSPLGKLKGDANLLPKLTALLLPHLEWERSEDKVGGSGLKEMFAHAANHLLKEGVSSQDENLLDYFISNGHLQRLMSTFVKFLGLISTGREEEAEIMAKKNKIPTMYQLYQQVQHKSLFSLNNLYRRGWKSLQTRWTKASPSRPSFTGPIKDSMDRRNCFRDGKRVPCDQFGGEGQGWSQLRSQEDLYDAIRRLVDEIKSGSHDGWHELTGLLVHTPVEDLQRLKQEHNLYAPADVKQTLTQRIQEELAHVGHQVVEQQQQQPQMKSYRVKNEEGVSPEPKQSKQQQSKIPQPQSPTPQSDPPKPEDQSPPKEADWGTDPPPIRNPAIKPVQREESAPFAGDPIDVSKDDIQEAIEQWRQRNEQEDVQVRQDELKYRKDPIHPDKPISERIRLFTKGDLLGFGIVKADENRLTKIEDLVKASNQAFNKVAYYVNVEGLSEDDPSLELLVAERERLEKEYADVLGQSELFAHDFLKNHLKANAEWEADVGKDIDAPRREMIDNALGFLRGVVSYGDKGHRDGGTVQVRSISSGEVQRDYYKIGTGIFLSSSKTTNPQVFVHEFGHHLEATVPGVHEAAVEFLAYRLRKGGRTIDYSNSPTRLSDKFPHRGFEKNEYGYEDEFGAAFGENAYYVGKIKTFADTDLTSGFIGNVTLDTTEIVSMGLEALYSRPAEFARKDPEYFSFIVGICTGELRSTWRVGS